MKLPCQYYISRFGSRQQIVGIYHDRQTYDYTDWVRGVVGINEYIFLTPNCELEQDYSLCDQLQVHSRHTNVAGKGCAICLINGCGVAYIDG